MTNERLYLDDRLSALEKTAADALGYKDIRSPYPMLSDKNTETDELLSTALRLGQKTEIIRLARLLGRGDLVLHFATPRDTLLLAEGFLLSSNSGEALRLLREMEKSVLYPYALLAEGDTLRALERLEALLVEKIPREPGVMLCLARTRSFLLPQDRSALDLVKKMARTEDERHFLDRKERLLFEPSDGNDLRETASEVLAGKFPRSVREELAGLLLPRLLEQAMLVELYDIWQTLPRDAQNDYPYTMLSSLSEEIELLRAFEQKADAVTSHLDPGSKSFRERYGNISRTPNWGMIYSRSSAFDTPGSKPSVALYDRVKKHLLFLLSTPRL